MRIIAGSARGRKIIAPEGRGTRPTSDRVKESVFGILQFIIPGKRVLDLFAGSGNLGLESLSRGAEHCVFVDHDRQSIQCISENARNMGFERQSELIKADFAQAIQKLSARETQFDLIFMDPPYAAGVLSETIKLILSHNLLSESGVIIAEHAAGQWQSDDIETCDRYDARNYGHTEVSFIRKVST